MPNSTAKRIHLYRFGQGPLDGIISPASYLRDGQVELISLEGTLQSVPLTDVKALCYVADTARPALFSEHTSFERRPKTPGVWTRFVLRDNDLLEGLLPNNPLEWPADGYLVTPPHADATRQKVFLPRIAAISAELLGIIGGRALSRKPPRSALPGTTDNQLEMFEAR